MKMYLCFIAFNMKFDLLWVNIELLCACRMFKGKKTQALGSVTLSVRVFLVQVHLFCTN